MGKAANFRLFNNAHGAAISDRSQIENQCIKFGTHITASPLLWLTIFLRGGQSAAGRRALSRLGYESEGITDILEALTANKVSWKQTRDFDESAVAALGF